MPRKLNVAIGVILLLFLSTLMTLFPGSEFHANTINIENVRNNSADVPDIEPLWIYETNHTVWSVAISADGQYVAAGNDGGEIYLLDREGTPQWEPYVTGFSVTGVAISSDGQYVVAGNVGGEIYLFDRSGNIPLWFYDSEYYVNSVAISADGEYVVVGNGWYSLYGKVYLFHLTSGIPIWTYSRGYQVSDVAISADGQYIAAADGDHGAFLLNRDGYLMENYPLLSCLEVTIAPDSGYMVVGRPMGCVDLFDLDSTLQWTCDIGEIVTSDYEFDVSSDDRYIVVGIFSPQMIYGQGGHVYLLNGDGELLWYYRLSDDSVPSVAVSDGGCVVAVGARVPDEPAVYAVYNEVFLFNADGTLLSTYDFGAAGGGARVSISSNGKYIAASSGNNVYLLEGCSALWPWHIATAISVVLLAFLVITAIIWRPWRRLHRRFRT